MILKILDICPNIIHHTGDIQVLNSSIVIPTEFVQSFENNNTTQNDNDYNYEDEAQCSHVILSTRIDNIIHSNIATKAQELSRTFQNYKIICKSISASLSKWISLPRHGEQFDIKFEPCLHNVNINITNTNEHVPIVTTSVLNPERMNRKRSYFEIRQYVKRRNNNISPFIHRKN